MILTIEKCFDFTLDEWEEVFAGPYLDVVGFLAAQIRGPRELVGTFRVRIWKGGELISTAYEGAYNSYSNFLEAIRIRHYHAIDSHVERY